MVVYSIALGCDVLVRAALVSFVLDSAARPPLQRLPGHTAALGCGLCESTLYASGAGFTFLRDTPPSTLRSAARGRAAVAAAAAAGTGEAAAHGYAHGGTLSPLTQLAGFDVFQQARVGLLHIGWLLLVRKPVKLMVKRYLGGGGSSAKRPQWATDLLAEWDAALADVDRHTTYTGRVPQIASMANFLNGVLARRLADTLMFAVWAAAEKYDGETPAKHTKIVTALRGLVLVLRGINTLQIRDATRDMQDRGAAQLWEGLKVLDAAFPSNGSVDAAGNITKAKGEGARGMQSLLPHQCEPVHMRAAFELFNSFALLDDADAEAKHQPVKARGHQISHGRPDTYGDSMLARQVDDYAQGLLDTTGRYGDGLRQVAGADLVAFNKSRALLPLALRGDRAAQAAGVVRLLTAGEQLPAASTVAAALAAASPLACWCHPQYYQLPAPVVFERRASAATCGADTEGIRSTFGVGAVAAKTRAGELLSWDAAAKELEKDHGGGFMGLQVKQCIELALPGLARAAGGAHQLQVLLPAALKLPGGAVLRVGDAVQLDRAGEVEWHRRAAVATGLKTPSDPIAAAAEPLLRGKRARHGEDYELWPHLYSVARVERIITVRDGAGVEHHLIVPAYFEFARNVNANTALPPALRFVRDTVGMRRCGVPTQGFLLHFWDGNCPGNMPVPLSLLRRLPNLVHYCNTGCKVEPAVYVCPHNIYDNPPPALGRLCKRACKLFNCKPTAKCERVVHACASGGKLWMLGEVEAYGSGRVQWEERS